MNQKLLDARKNAAATIEAYKKDTRQNSLNILLLGETGSGKSHFLTTCPRPVHIDSFDPGGTKHLRPEIDKGYVIADTSYESDDPFNPRSYSKWKADIKKRSESGYFDFIGTYCLDSATTWSASIMNWILKNAGMAGGVPRFTHDYHPQKVEIINYIRFLMRLPCHFILTGHLEGNKDEVTGQISYRFMTTGKGDVIIPLEFDEIWVADTKKVSSGVDYRLITKRTGPYVAATRIGRGVFDTYEEPDLKKMLKKANRSEMARDKDLLT